MARRKLVTGNWKMNGDRASLVELDAIAAAAADSVVEVSLALPATLIALAAERAPDLPIGAQDIHAQDKGAHTGCISAAMAREAGARFALVGHSERRTAQKEDDRLVRGKAAAAHRHGLAAILCVGETGAERDAGRAMEVVTGQVRQSLPDAAAADWLSIGYEPVWAVGTGLTPTLTEIAAMHRAIRNTLRERIGVEAERMRILYGGSVTPGNAADLMAIADVDGALVGGASLSAAAFIPIVRAASQGGRTEIR